MNAIPYGGTPTWAAISCMLSARSDRAGHTGDKAPESLRSAGLVFGTQAKIEEFADGRAHPTLARLPEGKDRGFMTNRVAISPESIADVLLRSRRRCCVCFALSGDSTPKRGQIAHLDRDASNNVTENLAFLCLEHHDEYDSRTRQSKSMTEREVKQFRRQLERFVANSLPATDSEVVRNLLSAVDRPAFRTPFHHESSLPKFRAAICETIAIINTGHGETNARTPSKLTLRDPSVRAKLDTVVERLVALRAVFDELLRTGEIRPCGCQDSDCPVHMLSDRAAYEMDRRRQALLTAAHELDPSFPARFYDIE
jgi:hypothetical protein